MRTPVPEVVEVRRNEDGTVTLTVDALFVEYATDRAFSHRLTLRPCEDGSVRLLTNEVVGEERMILPDYQPSDNILRPAFIQN